MVDSSSLNYFSNLDGLTKVFSHQSSRFVLISSVLGDEWVIRVGAIEDGHWWEGTWSEEDVFAIAGQHTAPEHLQILSQRLETTIMKGDLELDNLDAGLSKTKSVELILDPHAKRPLRVPLREMSVKEASRFAVKHLANLAERGQQIDPRLLLPSSSGTKVSSSLKRPRTPSPSRNNRVDPASSPIQTDRDSSPPTPSTKRHKNNERPYAEATKIFDPAAQAEIDKLKRQLTTMEQERHQSERALIEHQFVGGRTDLLASRSIKPAVTRAPNASLANPNQRARRYQAAEFASDSDE